MSHTQDSYGAASVAAYTLVHVAGTTRRPDGTPVGS